MEKPSAVNTYTILIPYLRKGYLIFSLIVISRPLTFFKTITESLNLSLTTVFHKLLIDFTKVSVTFFDIFLLLPNQRLIAFWIFLYIFRSFFTTFSLFHNELHEASFEIESKRDITKLVAADVFGFWEKATIPTIAHHSVINNLEKLLARTQEMEKSPPARRKASSYQTTKESFQKI